MTLYVKPAVPGAVVRDPVTRQALPQDGGEVPDNVYWRRRLPRPGIPGDVVEIPRPPAAAPATPQSAPAPLTNS